MTKTNLYTNSIKHANSECIPDSIVTAVLDANRDLNNKDKVTAIHKAIKAENTELLKIAYDALKTQLDNKRNLPELVNQILREFATADINLYAVNRDLKTGKYNTAIKTVALQWMDAEKYLNSLNTDKKRSVYTLAANKDAIQMQTVILSSIINYKSQDFNATTYTIKKTFDFGEYNKAFCKVPSINSIQEMINIYLQYIGFTNVVLRRQDVKMIIDNVITAQIDAVNTMQYKAKKERVLVQAIFAAVKALISNCDYKIVIHDKNVVTLEQKAELLKKQTKSKKSK